MEYGAMKELCEEKHKRIDERLDDHEKRITANGEELSTLKTESARSVVQIENVVKSVSLLTKAIWWLVGVMITGFSGFFIWYIQSIPHP